MWTLKVSYPQAPAGTVLYRFLNFDFGQAYAQHRLTGRDTVAVTTNHEGVGDFFVAFLDDLEEIKE